MSWRHQAQYREILCESFSERMIEGGFDPVPPLQPLALLLPFPSL